MSFCKVSRKNETDGDVVLDFMVVEKEVVEGETIVLVEKFFLKNREPFCALFISFEVVRCSCKVEKSSFDVVTVEIHDPLIEVVGVLLNKSAEFSL